MFGTLRGALAGRKIAFDREGFTASVEGRIVGHGKTIKIRSIHVHYELAVPADALEATERALAAHPAGCPAHESVKRRDRCQLGRARARRRADGAAAGL